MSVTPNRKEDYEHLCRTIQNWNENRLELFEISQPKENLEFEGVMRFYFQSADGDGQKVATKCMRVTSTSTTAQVVEALVQKFRPDLRMLTTPSLYTLYEVHADGEERMLDKNEHPLCVQLNWVEGNREGRFLLKKMASSNGLNLNPKKDKKIKDDKKKAKNKQKAPEALEKDSNEVHGSIARSLYTDMPESRLTRSISLKQGNMCIVHGEPGSEADSSFQVHVSADLLPDTPCKSLLVGDRDTASQIVRSAVEKYDIRDDPAKFCLVQVTVPNVPTTPDGRIPANVPVVEKVLEDSDLPLLLYSKWAATNGGGGALQFQLRRRASFGQNKSPRGELSAGSPAMADLSVYPILVEVIQGSVGGPQSNPRTFPLTTTPAEVGSDPKCCVHLTSGGIRPRHCTIASSGNGGTFMIAPLDRAATIQVNNKLVKACTTLPNSAILKLGDAETFQFLAPSSAPNKPGPVPLPNAQEARMNSRQGQPGAPNLSKAFSSEDILNPSTSNSLKRPLKARAYSEFHLPGDGTPKGQGSTPESDTPAVESKGASFASVDALEWAILPASLFFYHAKGPLLLQTLILDVEGYTLQFKLGPAFALYMMARCYLSPDFQPGASTSECKKNLVLTLKNVATNIKRAIKENRNIAGPLAFWLANTSELLHFLKRDLQLSLLSHEYSNLLTQLIRSSYRHFTEYMLRELNVTISAFLDETSDADTEDAYLLAGGKGDTKEPDVVPTTAQSQLFAQTAIYWSVSESRMRRRGRPTMGDVLFTLNSTLALLQSCRVNATLCVLTFSSLFHYISTRLFNKLVSEPGKYCSSNVGMRLGKRVERIVAWAETQGMELPAQEHLMLILQAASSLRMPKDSSQDAQKIFSTCSHLNSLQMNTLLMHVQANEGEAVVSEAVVKKLVALAMLHTDKQLQAEGRSIHLEEDISLELPFHVPEDRYYCDGLVGVPSGLQEYLEPSVSAGLCKLKINGEASGSSWISPAHMSDSCHSLEMFGENGRSATLPRSLGASQKCEDASDATITIKGYSTLPRQPPHDARIVQLAITKEDTSNSLGISITGGKGSTFGDVGIFIRSLTVGGAAQVDGRLSRGDQILMVDGKNLEGATQQQAASVLRSTGKTITLTVAKHAAHYQGLQALISHNSPRNTRQDLNIPEGTSHAQKAKRKQRRERAQQHCGDPRLDSRKDENIPERSTTSLPQHEHLLAKWLSEQRVFTLGHGDDHRSSTSTLSNIPEQERPVSPTGPSLLRLGLGEGRSVERHSTSTPPIRDSGLTRPRDSDSSTFSSLVQLEMASMEASTRYSDYSQELEYHRQLLAAGPALAQSHPLHGNPLPYSDTFNLSSQSALQSQSFPPIIMSQQRVTAQDRLSMDVLQHTQPSSASLSGVGAVLAKVKASSAIIGGKNDAHFLLSSDLKGLEMDDIELEKQRIHLLLYEEQKEKELTTSKEKELLLEEESEVSEEELHLRKELSSIEEMIAKQKKILRDHKYNREREEKRLKETEKQLQDIIVQTTLLSGDQQRQLEQKQRQSELEQRKREHSRRIHTLLGNEHNSKTKLLALERNVAEIQKQLQQYEKCPQKEDVTSKAISMVAPRQDDEFSEKGSSDVPRPGSPSVIRQLKLPELDTTAEGQWINPSRSVVPGLSNASSRGVVHASKAMSASDLSEPSEDGDSRPAKLSVAYDNASRPNPPRTSDQYSYKSHSRDDISSGRARDSYERPRKASVEGMLGSSAGEHAFISPQQSRGGEGRYYRGREPYEVAVTGRSNSSSEWYQSSMQPHIFQRPSSANSRSDSPSAYNRPDQGPPIAYSRPDQGPPIAYSRPDQGPPIAYSRPDQGPPIAYNRPDQGPPIAYSRPDQGPPIAYSRPDQGPPIAYSRPDQGPPITYSRPDQGPSSTYNQPNQGPSNTYRFDQGSSNVYNKPVNGRSDQQAPSGFQNRMEPGPTNVPGRSEQRISGTGSRPGSAFSDHRSDLEPTRMGTVPAGSRPDTNGRLGHHYSRQTKSRGTQRSLNQSSSADNLIATAESVGTGSARQAGTPDVVPSVRGEKPTGAADCTPDSPNQPLPSGRASRESDVTFSADISSPRLSHAKHKSDVPPVVPGGDRMRSMTFSGVGNPASRPTEQVLPQQGRAIPQGYVHDAASGKLYGQVQSSQAKPYELVAPMLQSNLHEPGRSYSAAQGRSCEQVVIQQGQQGRPYGLQGRPNDQLPQARSYDQSVLQGRSYEQPLLQGRSYDQAPRPQGRPYEQVMPAQRTSHDNVPVQQGRPYDQAPVAQGTQGRSFEQVALAQGRTHDTIPAQRRLYEQSVLQQGKPQEQSWATQSPLPGRPYESSTLPTDQLQGQRPAPYERTFLGGDLLNVGRNPVGYPSKTGSHSYSRRRPDPPQQVMMTLEDKMKHYMEGMEEPSYPDRIQRQQTEL